MSFPPQPALFQMRYQRLSAQRSFRRQRTEIDVRGMPQWQHGVMPAALITSSEGDIVILFARNAVCYVFVLLSADI